MPLCSAHELHKCTSANCQIILKAAYALWMHMRFQHPIQIHPGHGSCGTLARATNKFIEVCALGVGDELVHSLALLVQLRLHSVCVLLVALAPLQGLLRQLVVALLHRQLRPLVPVVLRPAVAMLSCLLRRSMRPSALATQTLIALPCKHQGWTPGRRSRCWFTHIHVGSLALMEASAFNLQYRSF